ncbi:putative C-type lectin domain family 20 member A [Lates japonicus]|uniref:C-type lectin domain family 20 member A n=1 Tax=Lates japonicus TaxID=270547 RepID=A0AAD3N2A2_LATJO|nr:putative C-type lectin domain family 20 member A [Lates japonicus]
MKKGRWKFESCNETKPFFCYDDKVILINQSKTWVEALYYCRENHYDLVSITNLEQVLSKRAKEKANTSLVWLGLLLWVSGSGDTWRWSNESNVSFRYWDLEFFKDERNKICAMTVLDRWSSDECDEEKPFFCDDDEVILINESKTWEEALNYCRENHSDLVSITNPHQQRWVQRRAKKASTPLVWLGLRYTCTLDLWFWVNDHRDGSKENKASTPFALVGTRYTCTLGLWFWCDEVILIKESKTWEEALNYCRENYSDLVSITNPHRDGSRRAKKASTPLSGAYSLDGGSWKKMQNYFNIRRKSGGGLWFSHEYKIKFTALLLKSEKAQQRSLQRCKHIFGVCRWSLELTVRDNPGPLALSITTSSPGQSQLVQNWT